MNRVPLIIFLFSLGVSIVVALSSSVSIESRINTISNITKFSIADGRNLTNFYGSQKRLLEAIASDKYAYLQNVFVAKVSEHKKLIGDLQLNNVTNCMEYSNKKMKDSIVIALRENDKCQKAQKSILINLVDSKLREKEIQSAFSACFKVPEITNNYLNCIDQYMVHHHHQDRGDESIKKVYNNTIKFILNLKDTMVSSLDTCMKKPGNILNPAILYADNEFRDCIEKQAIMQIETDDGKILNHGGVIKNLDIKNNNLTNLCRIHIEMMKIIESQHRQSILTYENNLINYYRSIIESTDVAKKNITCCSNFSNLLANRAVRNALNTTNDCFCHLRSNFDNFINSIIQNVELSNLLKICHKKNSSSQSMMILECYDRTILLLSSPSLKNSYEKAKLRVKKYMSDEFLSEAYKCLSEPMNIFSHSLHFSNAHFDWCLESQKFGNRCVKLTLNEYDYKILFILNIISLDLYNILMDESDEYLSFPTIPRVG